MRKYFALLILLFFAVGINAQTSTHTVESKETLYSISKKYDVSVEELMRLNPEKKDGKLNIGDVLILREEKKYGKIIVESKQTIYGITKRYKISETELRILNPSLINGMKIGDELTLPLENIQKYGSADSVKATPIVEAKKTETLASQPKDDQYVIQPKDNYYKITKNFNLTKKQLFQLNSDLKKKGLIPGDVIVVKGDLNQLAKLNKNNSKNNKPAPIKPTTSREPKVEYINYTTVPGDTKYSIANKFGASVDELLTNNPSLMEIVKPGTVVKVRKTEPSSYTKLSPGLLNIAIMLPFGLEDRNAKYKSLALDFATGAKLAVQRKINEGHQLSVKFIDAGTETLSNKALEDLKAFNPDLVIGPFFKTSILAVLDAVKDRKVPVVAPFANAEDMYDHSNLIIVETEEEVFADRMVKEVADVYENQKIYIVSNQNRTNANLIKTRLEKVIDKPNIVIIASPNEIVPDKNMMTGQDVPMISVLSSDDDELSRAFAKKIIELAKAVEDTKAFSVFYNPEFDKNINALSQASLVYIANRMINVEGSFEKEILSDYKKIYCKTPSKYTIIGFDVVNDMLSRENPTGNIFKKMDKIQTQLATKFEFVRAKTGGAYINVGYRVVRLLP